MKKLIFGLLLSISISACSISEPEGYLNIVTYELNKASDFEYTGNFEVKELPDGELELAIRLFGATGSQTVTFPAHLHFGSYDTPDAKIAVILTAVNANTLTSRTILPQLANGDKLTFEDFKNFNGHIKVHLANEGPDYQVILVAGNIGFNADLSQSFDPEKITICSKDF